MKHLTDTIREALEFFECGSYSTSKALSALTALSELERLAGEQKPVARVDGEGQVAWFAPIPEDGANLYATPPAQQPHDHVAVTWDAARTRILAVTLQDAEGRVLCVIDEAPAQQPQYEAGDMASAHNDGFRAGVASVAQQPHEIEVQCPVCNHKFYEWPNDQQPQADIIKRQANKIAELTADRDGWIEAHARLHREYHDFRKAAPQQAEAITENTSDGYHTFKELYAFRKAYNAALFNEWAQTGKCQVHKSWRHHDGELCFGGGWFIVVAALPDGQISNHYEAKDWELFNIPETAKALYEFDGHTGADVIARLEAYKGAAPQQAEAVRWCPDVCPITGKPFFMWIEHPQHGDVPTYGGPYDSYTIPVRHEDGSFCCERYDHDNGWWVTDEVHDVGVQIVSDQAYVSDEAPQQAEAVPKDHPLYVFATEVIHGAYRYTELPAKARAAIDTAMAQGANHG